MDVPTFAMATSVAATFNARLPEGCASELAQSLRQRPERWHNVNPHAFERLVTDVFRANHRACEVFHVGGPGDGGVDVVFIDGESRRWLIQTKRRANGFKSEGVSTLRSIVGTLALSGDTHGMIVTTADAFSQSAISACHHARMRGFTVELIDKGRLDRMLGPLMPVDAWRGALAHPLFSVVEDDARRVLCAQMECAADGSFWAEGHKAFNAEEAGQLTLFDS